MTSNTGDELSGLRKRYGDAGQGHVFQFIDELEDGERSAFIEQLKSVDLDLVRRHLKEMRADSPVSTLDLDRLEAPKMVPVPSTPGSRRKESRARAEGEKVLREGKVAAFVVAGGQGSRLGFEGPKGCFPIGPITRCSLFEWHLSKVVATRKRYGSQIPVFIMTSDANHRDTCEFLEARGYFGLPEDDVVVFRQGMLPAVDEAGRIILSARNSLFLSPDGHGGSIGALAREGVLDLLEQRGIEDLFYFQIDNPLVKVLDPVFLGHHRLGRSEASSKAVLKRSPEEKVGVFARSGRKVGIVEYSDLPAEMATETDDDGRLRFRAANIAIHIFQVAFLKKMTDGGLRLPYHRARKEVHCVDIESASGDPVERMGIKFETFVFDALPKARRPLVVETLREEEFSPVKNAEGDDSPASSARDLISLFTSWCESAGFKAPAGDALMEISPLFALDRSEFVDRLRKQKMLASTRLFMG